MLYLNSKWTFLGPKPMTAIFFVQKDHAKMKIWGCIMVFIIAWQRHRG
jgi:hypothetical protein